MQPKPCILPIHSFIHSLMYIHSWVHETSYFIWKAGFIACHYQTDDTHNAKSTQKSTQIQEDMNKQGTQVSVRCIISVYTQSTCYIKNGKPSRVSVSTNREDEKKILIITNIRGCNGNFYYDTLHPCVYFVYNINSCTRQRCGLKEMTEKTNQQRPQLIRKM